MGGRPFPRRRLGDPMRHQTSRFVENSDVDLRYPAWLETDYGVMSCTITRISAGRAQIYFPEDRPLRAEFDLWLTQNGGCRRRCRLVERKGSRILVDFVHEPLPRPRPLASSAYGSWAQRERPPAPLGS